MTDNMNWLKSFADYDNPDCADGQMAKAVLREITTLQAKVERLEGEAKPIEARVWRMEAEAVAMVTALNESQAKVKRLERGIKAVDALIAESAGVYGLHLNGDPSPWSDLLAEGRYEDWLIGFSAALEVTDG